MTIVYKTEPPKERSIHSHSIPACTVFTGRDPEGISSVFLKTYNGLVDLANPNRTYSIPLLIDNYVVVNAVLTISLLSAA